MSSLSRWATPLTAASSMIMGVTGVLMFFHLDSGLNVPLHEWAGWLMVLGVAAHIVLNWRPFVTYLKRPLARVILAAGVILLALSFYPAVEGKHPVDQVMQALSQSDIVTVIALSGQELDRGLQQLAAAGFQADENMTLAQLTDGSRGRQMQVINLLFSGNAVD